MHPGNALGIKGKDIAFTAKPHGAEELDHPALLLGGVEVNTVKDRPSGGDRLLNIALKLRLACFHQAGTDACNFLIPHGFHLRAHDQHDRSHQQYQRQQCHQ